MVRTALLWLLAAALSASLAGCALLGIGAPPEPITLRLGYRAGTVQLEPLLAQFQAEHPHITVETVVAGRWGGDLHQRVAQGHVDLLRDNREALGLVGRELLRPLDPVHLAEWDGIRDDYYRGVWEALAVGGQQWGIPAGLDTTVLYANVDTARALGLSLPVDGQPWGSFEFLGLAAALNYPDGLPQGDGAPVFGFCTDPGQLDPFLFVYLWGGRIVDDLNNPRAATLDQAETIEALRFYTSLFTQYEVAPKPDVLQREVPGGVEQAIVTGRCGMWLGLFSNRGGLDAPERWEFDWEMLSLPQVGGEWALADVSGYFVTANSEYPQEALLLARFLADHAEASGSLAPPRRSLTADPAFEAAVGAQAAERARAIPDQLIIIPTELSPELVAVAQAVMQSVQQSIQQDVDVEQLLLMAQRALQRGR